MGLITEFRSSLENPQTPLSFPAEWLADIYNGGRTDSGIRVSQMTALQLPIVFACVNIVANGMAMLPFNVVEIGTGTAGRRTKKIAHEHDLFDLLHSRPHPEFSSKTLRFVMMCHALLWGNSYVEILYNGLGEIKALAPRMPWKCIAVRLREDRLIDNGLGQLEKYPKGTLVYKTIQGMSDDDINSSDQIRDGQERMIAPENMLYIPGLTLDGRIGQDTVWLMRQAIGLALITEKFGAKYFGNGAHPGGILELLGSVPKEEMEKARNSIQENTGGENAHRIHVVKGGTKFTPISNPNDTSQFLQTREHQLKEIGMLFRVPSHMLGDSSGSNKATAEQMGQEFVTNTLGPWIPAFEQEFKYKLFTLPNQRGRNAGRYEVKLDTHNLMYPDATSKSDFYQKGKLSGWLCTNDIHELEGMNPVSEENGGEDFWQPVNVTVIGAEPPEPASGATGSTEEPGAPEQKSAPDFSNQIVAALPLFSDAFSRYSKRDKPDSADFEKAFSAAFISLRDGIKAVCAADLGVTAPEAMPDTDKFLRKLASGMHKRAAEFNADAEVKRAVTAISIEVYRELAVRRVKS